jgi:ankyrin repeat protein
MKNCLVIMALLSLNVSSFYANKNLLESVQGNNFELVKALVEEDGVDIDIQGPDGETPLMKALDLGLNEIASYLIEQGADVNIRTRTGLTALHKAAGDNKISIMTFMELINAGAVITPPKKEGVRFPTPLQIAFSTKDNAVKTNFLWHLSSQKDLRDKSFFGSSSYDYAKEILGEKLTEGSCVLPGCDLIVF